MIDLGKKSCTNFGFLGLKIDKKCNWTNFGFKEKEIVKILIFPVLIIKFFS